MAKRSSIQTDTAARAGLSLAKHIVPYIEHKAPKGAIIAGYFPINKEIDPIPTLKQLHENGYLIALPVIEAYHEPLIFHLWAPGEPVQPGKVFNRVYEPASTSLAVTPNVILVPLLAFDHTGHRLGYGGGFYDRTLAQWQNTPSTPCTIGIGYDFQETDTVYNIPTDQSLHTIATESRLIEITS